MTRPRIDLDGVSLSDARTTAGPSMVLALFRYRTTEGLVLVLPESADLLVPWANVEETALDLRHGTLVVRFTKAYAESQNWLRGATTLTGTWTDRLLMSATGAKPPA
jgi:hypothetical protein